MYLNRQNEEEPAAVRVMSRTKAREIALHLIFEMGFRKFEEEQLDERLDADIMASISGDIALYAGKLSEEQKAAFDAVDLGEGVIPQDELLSKRLPEMPAELVPIIEEIWTEEVVGK